MRVELSAGPLTWATRPLKMWLVKEVSKRDVSNFKCSFYPPVLRAMWIVFTHVEVVSLVGRQIPAPGLLRVVSTREAASVRKPMSFTPTFGSCPTKRCII